VPGVPFGAFDTADFWVAMNASSLQKFSVVIQKVVWGMCHTHPFNGPFSGTTRVSRYQKGITNLDFNEARDGKWQWHQLGHMQVCT